MEKAALRKVYIEKRKALDAAECERRSQAIAEEFFMFPLSGVKFLHVFYPIPGKQEVDVLLVADWIRRHYPGIQLVLSRSNADDRSLSHIPWNDYTPLAMNKWGITEPVSGKELAAHQLDMVLVPLLAFDRKGNRLGYGKGFYDRFLEQCRTDVAKVGVSFFEAEEEGIDIDERDIPLDFCITPGRTYVF